jgi:diguanylate cyclase (GGDEF)-like protein
VTTETALLVIAIALVANLVLVLIALIVPRVRRGRATPAGTIAAAAPRAGLSPAAPAPAPPAPPAAPPTPSPIRTEFRPPEAARSAPSVNAIIDGAEREPAGSIGGMPLVDPQTGLDTIRAWTVVFEHESARLRRYGRTATVVVAELDGLDALAARLGRDVADGLVPPVADALRRNARGPDRVCRARHNRFLVLMPETDEVAAINYIERVRTACDLWLESGALAVRLVMGWASPPPGGTLEDALRLAGERMMEERRRRAGGGATEGSASAPSSTETSAD